jgi:CRP/FNR family transcriptional regulator, cyclic AMP receptor protein
MPPSSSAAETAAKLLRKHRLFAGLSQENLVGLAEKCRVKYADPGEILIDEAWPAAPGLYILTDGVVRIERRTGVDRVVLAQRSTGDSVGELSLLDGLPPSASVVAATEVEAVLLPREEFLACLERSRSLSLELLKVLAQRLREAGEERVSAQTKDVRARLAGELLNLAQKHTPLEPRPIIRLDVSQAEMGRRLGVSRESVNKALRSLQDGDPPPLTPFGVNRGAFRADLEVLRSASRQQ